jgi:hypothetical protein
MMYAHMMVCKSHIGLCIEQAQFGDGDDQAHQGPSKQQHGAFKCYWSQQPLLLAALEQHYL